jgi:hypothetical protein
VPAYKICLNTSGFQWRKSSLKEQLQRQYLPHYWRKCGMDQKAVRASGEDRLSELTTGQIDRIIDMEKIKSLLYDRKRRVQEAYFHFDDSHPNLHQNIYQANFLAKVNQIAIDRNIRHEDLEGFDELVRQKLEKLKLKNQQKHHLKMPYKYAKHYASQRCTKTEQDEEVRSIDSIQDDLELFEERLKSPEIHRSQTKRERGKAQTNKLLPPKRWFYGMSTYYLNKNQPDKVPEKQETSKSDCFDIEAEVRLINELRSASFHSKPNANATHSTASSKKGERMASHKINHITMLKLK